MDIITIYLQQLVAEASVFQPKTIVSINVQRVRWDQLVHQVELGSLAHPDHQVVMESPAPKVAKAKVLKDHAVNQAKQVQKVHLVKMDHLAVLDQREKRDRKVMPVSKHEVSLVSIDDKNLLSENLKSSTCQEPAYNYYDYNHDNNHDYVNNFSHDNYCNRKIDTYNQQKADNANVHDQTNHDHINYFHNDYLHNDNYHYDNFYDYYNNHNNNNDINDDMDRSSDVGPKVPSCWELPLYNGFLFDIFHQQNQKICLPEMPRF